MRIDRTRTRHPVAKGTMFEGLTVAEAREMQLHLRDRIVFHPPRGFAPRRVAGADVAFDQRRKLAFAAVVVIDLRSMADIEATTASTPVTFPYVPGYLSFRELPALAAAWKKVESRPDLLVLDAHGYAHPRRLGLASHAGILLDVPAIGCAKSVLCGRYGPLEERRGARSSLLDPKNGEEIGWALRTRDGVRPVFVSVGHRMDVSTAAELILELTPGGRRRLPETTRRADRLAAEAKQSSGAG